MAPRTLSKSDLRLSLRGRRPEHPSGEVGPLGTPWGLYAPVVGRLARAPHFVLTEKTYAILSEFGAPLAPRTLSKSDLRLSLRGRRPELPSGEVGPLGTPWGLYAPVVRRSARAPHFVLAEKTYGILRQLHGLHAGVRQGSQQLSFGLAKTPMRFLINHRNHNIP